METKLRMCTHTHTHAQNDDNKMMLNSSRFVQDSCSKLVAETKERKRLHNLVQELKGNIRVSFSSCEIHSRMEKSAREKNVKIEHVEI